MATSRVHAQRLKHGPTSLEAPLQDPHIRYSVALAAGVIVALFFALLGLSSGNANIARIGTGKATIGILGEEWHAENKRRMRRSIRMQAILPILGIVLGATVFGVVMLFGEQIALALQ